MIKWWQREQREEGGKEVIYQNIGYEIVE